MFAILFDYFQLKTHKIPNKNSKNEKKKITCGIYRKCQHWYMFKSCKNRILGRAEKHSIFQNAGFTIHHKPKLSTFSHWGHKCIVQIAVIEYQCFSFNLKKKLCVNSAFLQSSPRQVINVGHLILAPPAGSSGQVMCKAQTNATWAFSEL